MGCAGCGSHAEGKPAGCQSNGNCSSGGCNRLNVFDWLADIPMSDLSKPFPIVEVSFNQGSRKDFFHNNTSQIYKQGDLVAVEGSSGGFDVGEVSLSGELVRWQMKKKHVKEEDAGIKKVLRLAESHDLELYKHAKSLEKEILIRSRVIAKEHQLEMKITQVEVQADSKKITFFYTAERRVDFRTLIKSFASEFKAKIEMRQIGARQESAKLGGIGSCGRELCCSTWVTDFKTVNTAAARYQNLSINQAKLSGQCGRLKCCLNFELDMYMDALKNFPRNAETLELASGRATLQKKDIFRNIMWYSFAGSNKQYPLTIERVKEIRKLNEQGEKPEELKATEVKSLQHFQNPDTKADMGFINDVGQISLESLTTRKGRRNRNTPGRQRNRQGGAPNAGANASGKQKGNTAGHSPHQHQKPKRRRTNTSGRSGNK